MIDIKFKQNVVDNAKIRRIQKEYNCNYNIAKIKLGELRRNKK